MKTLIIVLSLLISSTAIAQEGLWVSNRTRIGYDQFFTGVQFRLSEYRLMRTSFDAGMAFRLNDVFLFEPRYVLRLPVLQQDPLDHQFRLALKFTFK